FREANVDIEDIRSLDDMKLLPFTNKEELRDAYPLGLQSVPDSEVVRIHSSSGTTGKPIIIPYTRKDVDVWAEMMMRCYMLAGLTNQDRIQITPGYGLWTAGIGFQLGAERLGAMAIPTGPGNTEKQLELFVDLKSTALASTSSYALLLAEEIEKRGLKSQIQLRKGIIGSERWSEKMRSRIENELGIETFDIYGLTEIYGPGIGLDCSLHEGVHYWSDHLLFEIIDPITGEQLPDGTLGELVITTLTRKGLPSSATGQET
ncbi:MAG TPA: AMP-binding protein, partial [Methanosarcina vacuolata]|nr:AMP-binding protein [Methanosarcina vacuolata]